MARSARPGVKDEVRALASVLRDSSLDVAWRQWHALGASAALQGRDSRRLQSMIDPEALVLLSLVMVEDERRFGDLVHDWMIRNSDLLSVQRVKNLAKEYPKATQQRLRARLEWLAEAVLHSGKDFRWRSLASTGAGHSDDAARNDQKHGIALRQSKSLPNKATAKARAVRTRLTEPSALLLRLRLGLGVGVKADVIGFLLGKGEDWVTVREIASATAYTSVAVRRAVDDLAAARLILALEAQPAGYRAERARWASFLGVDATPVWQNWHQRFTFVVAFLHWAEGIERRPLSAYAFGALGRELLEQHRRAFENDLIAVWSMHTDVPDWGVFVTRAVQSLSASMIEWA